MNDLEIDNALKEHKSLIENEARKYSTFVAYPVILAEAYVLAKKAIKSYDKNSGAKLSTHIVNGLKKLSRSSTEYGNVIRLPEALQFKLKKLNDAEKIFTEENGRAPSVEELADESKLGLHVTKDLLTRRKTEVNVNNLAYTPTFIQGQSEQDDWIRFVYHDLSPKDKLIFEHKTGFGGKPVLPVAKISKKLNLTPSVINNRIAFISNKIQEGF